MFKFAGGRNQYWTPDNLGDDILAEWFHAADLSASPVVTWTGRKAKLAPTQGTASRRPAWSATGFQSTYPAVTPDGVDDFLSVAVGTKIPSGTYPGGVYGVGVCAAGSTNRFLVDYGTAAASQRRSILAATSSNRFVFQDATAQLTDTVDVVTSPQMFGCEFGNGLITAYINDHATTPATVASSFNTGTTTFAIFSSVGGASVGPWTLAELIITRTNLSTANRNKLFGYWAWVYGLTGNLASDHPYKNNRPGG